jgi:glycosyltransferase involved in cell wall biosynthesis
MPLPDLCVVVPAYNEEKNLPTLFNELSAACGAAKIDFTLLVVDDGSRDGSAGILTALANAHPNVGALLLSRNFGHQAAISIGLQHAAGRAIAVMDADLQDSPVDLVTMYRRWEEGADVVYAVRRSRRENVLRRAAYSIFYRLFASLSAIPVQMDAGDFSVMDADFAAKLVALPERLRFVRGLRAWMGGRQIAMPVDRDARRAGEPQYTLWKLIRLAVDGMVSFSDAPLRLASVAGAIVAAVAFAGVIIVLVWKLMGLLPDGGGIATIALSVLFLGGIQLLTVGILGEYIGRIFQEVKRRPIAVISQVIGSARAE